MKARINIKIGLFLVFFLLISAVGYSQMTPKEHTRLKAFAAKQKLEQEKTQRALESQARMLGIPMEIVHRDRTTYTLRAIVNGHPIYDGIMNSLSQITTSADDVKNGGNLGLDLTGAGINMGIWEAFEGGSDAMVRNSHDEFDGRVTLRDAGTFSSHATHVAGTMIAQGLDASAEGFANGSTLQSFDISNDLNEMANAALDANPVIISNHSYGTRTGWNFNSDSGEWEYTGPGGSLEDWKFGAYSDQTRDWDQTAFNAPFLLIMKSSGNDRGDGPNFISDGEAEIDGGADGFDCIPTYGNAKNIMTIGAIAPINNGYTGPGSVIMSNFSSWGPTDDGRIKPDIVTDGVALYSSDSASDTDYGFKSGTSMAAPSASGGAALLYEHWDNVIGGTPRASTMKALIIESADESGTTIGPDYSFGWGIMNVADGAEIITTEGFNGCSHYDEGIIEEDETITYTIESSGLTPIRVTLVWHDPASDNTNNGTLNPGGLNLVNDLDLRVTKDGDTFLPWILDPSNPGNAAVRGNNFRDNVEQVLILTPEAGTYTISVSAPANLENDSQVYSIWWIGNDATIDNQVVSGITFNADDEETYTADISLQFGSAVTVNAGADVKGYAGDHIRLVPGFHAQNGSSFLARILPGGGCGGFTGDIKIDNYPGFDIPKGLNQDITMNNVVQNEEKPFFQFSIFPNPTAKFLNCAYRLDKASTVSIVIVNSVGQVVDQVITNKFQESGDYGAEVDVENWPDGVYHFMLQTETETHSKSFVVSRN